MEQVPILYADATLIAIDKPAGLLAVPDRFDAALPSASHLLGARLGPVFVVHRLDRETSGVMIVARTAEAHARLCAQFEARQVHKEYLAIVDGVVREDDGVIDLALADDPHHAGRSRVDPVRGKPAHTAWHVVERYASHTLLRLNPTTGRQHQIRVHCAATGHPLTVDALYGAREAFRLSAIKRHYRGGADERPLVARCTLHAARLVLAHPETAAPCAFEAPLPRDLRALTAQLRKWDVERIGIGTPA